MNKAILLLALFAFAAVANATISTKSEVLAHLWSTWKIKFGKVYTATEEVRRLAIFAETLATIAQLNKEHTTARFGVNQFSDLTSEEFKAMYASGAKLGDIVGTEAPLEAVNFPESVDWRSKGVVTPVKNQGSCGSCWTFSATGAIEGFYAIRNGKLLSFSEQQMVDCAKAAGHGCQGGWPYLAIQYAAQNGLEVQSDYPYTAKDGSCKYNSAKAVKVASGYTSVTQKSSDLLKAAIATAPVSVLVQADQSAFQNYKSGVLTTGCGASVNHAVLAVGYQKLGNLDAFIIKNSWGTTWGAAGYIYLSTLQSINNGQGICGVLVQPILVR